MSWVRGCGREGVGIGLPGEAVPTEAAALRRTPRAGPAAAIELIGDGPRMRLVRDEAAMVAASDMRVSLVGESGTGKTVLARWMHERSPRSQHPFEYFLCGGAEPTLVRGELFGRMKGAYTGASDDCPGCLERTHGGSVLLDEIADLCAEGQAALPHFLDGHGLKRLGGRRALYPNVRIFTASKVPLAELVTAGRLREDLRWRLEHWTLVLPPLRERMEDLEALVAHALAEAARRGLEPAGLSAPVRAILWAYRWPGNVREALSVLTAAAQLARGGTIEPRHIRPEVRAAVKPILGGAVVVSEVEAALVAARGSIRDAARLLNVSEKTVGRAIRAEGIEVKAIRRRSKEVGRRRVRAGADGEPTAG